MNIKLLTEHHLEFPNLNGGCTSLSESTLVKMPHCWKSHVAAQIIFAYVDIRRLLKVTQNPKIKWGYTNTYNRYKCELRNSFFYISQPKLSCGYSKEPSH